MTPLAPRGNTQFLRAPPSPKGLHHHGSEKPDLGHRRHAIQIVAQLPETQADALLILEAAREFVLKFLAEDQREADRDPPGFAECVVLTLVPAALALASAASSAAADLKLPRHPDPPGPPARRGFF